MLWTIVRREITSNILSFRFLMGLLIYFSLIVTNLFVLTRGYEDRLQSYQTALREFVQHARRYRQRFVDFIQSENRADNESYHVYLVKEGLSQKPVAFSSIPKFSEKLTVDITFKGALLDVMLLVLLALLLFMTAVLAFMRSDVK